MMPNIFLAQFNPKPNQLALNSLRIMELMKKAKDKDASVIIFGETALQGYNVRNSLFSDQFLTKTEECLKQIKAYADHLQIGIILGTYQKNTTDLGKPAKNGAWTYFPPGITGLTEEHSYQQKQLIPRQTELDEVLYVAAGNRETMQVRTIGTKKVVYHICQDSWRQTPSETYPEDPLQQALDLQADALINLSASPWYEKKWYEILQYMLELSNTHQMTIIYLPIAGFENNQFIFTAGGFVVNHGKIKRLLKRFSEDETLINLETLAEEPDIEFNALARSLPSDKQAIKIQSTYSALEAVVQSIASQYGIIKDQQLNFKPEFIDEIQSFFPNAVQIIEKISQSKKTTKKNGFALEFIYDANVFLMIHLLRKQAPNSEILLNNPDKFQFNQNQLDFLEEQQVTIFQQHNVSFRAHANKNKLLLLDTINLTDYCLDELNINLYGLSILGSLTLSVVYKLLYYCQLQLSITMPNDQEILQQKLIDYIIKQIQKFSDFDQPKIANASQPYFEKKLKNSLFLDDIKKKCQDIASSVLEEAYLQTNNRIVNTTVVQLSLFAATQKREATPPMIQEITLDHVFQ